MYVFVYLEVGYGLRSHLRCFSSGRVMCSFQRVENQLATDQSQHRKGNCLALQSGAVY